MTPICSCPEALSFVAIYKITSFTKLRLFITTRVLSVLHSPNLMEKFSAATYLRIITVYVLI